MKTKSNMTKDKEKKIKPKCNRCNRPATIQTANGKYQESIGALPQNFGWYCQKCFNEGLKIENEAMYGE